MVEYKKYAFTLTEAILAMVIIGIIATLCTAGYKIGNPINKGWVTLSEKMAIYIEDASLQILLNHCDYDDFTSIKNGKIHFSIEDEGATKRISDLFQKYMSDIDMNVDLSDKYFEKKITNINKEPTEEKIKDAYSDFFFVNDGMLMGFRLYQSCNATENNANPPRTKGKYSVENVCGSIFYDVNGLEDPNILGLDQYILPIYKRGIKYNN